MKTFSSMSASVSVVFFLIFLIQGPSPSAARGRTSSLNRKPEPEPQPEPEPVEERDYDAASGCQYMGKFVPAPRQPGHGVEKSDWGKTVYSGGFRDCLYHGEGVKRYSDGRIYDGDWVLGKPHGVGKFQYSNGKEQCIGNEASCAADTMYSCLSVICFCCMLLCIFV